MISTPDLIILLRLVIAHIFADFFLQRYHWIVDKRTGTSSTYLYYHVLIVGGITYLLLGDWTQWQVPLFIMVTHFFIDWWKSTRRDCTRNFILDQLLHFLMIVIAWLWYIGFDVPHIETWLTNINTLSFWAVIAGYLLILRPAGFLIAKATCSWQQELGANTEEPSGLTDAGTWIGYLERFIILSIILIGNFSAIGFLIAAKSIFRYNGEKEIGNHRKQAEYILIGTLMSFLIAMIVGIVVRAVA